MENLLARMSSEAFLCESAQIPPLNFLCSNFSDDPKQTMLISLIKIILESFHFLVPSTYPSSSIEDVGAINYFK